jgi:hypothetical protein
MLQLLPMQVRIYVSSFLCSCGSLWTSGDNHNAKPDYFQDIVDTLAIKPKPSQKMEVIFQHRVCRFDQSIQEDAYFWYGPLEMVGA